MKNLILLLICFFWNLSFSQTFLFQMYFEDATGQKDTLTFGYDAAATDSIDASFQEMNIISQPWSNQFEARIAVFAQNFCIGGEFATDPIAGLLKKQIKKEDCIDQIVSVSYVQLKNAVYPISITWDSTLFNDPCRSNSIITDWHPGGWFDVIIGNNPQYPTLLKDLDSASFTHTETHHINGNQDTTDVLFVALGNIHQVFVGLDEPTNNMNIYPNPTTGVIHLDLNGNQHLQSLTLVNLNGQRFETNVTSDQIDISGLSAGIYFLEVLFDSGKMEQIKVIKP
ncbi:MAG: T9SS type A sorting domain-containing protein [Flavobacteriales bacterium]